MGHYLDLLPTCLSDVPAESIPCRGPAQHRTSSSEVWLSSGRLSANTPTPAVWIGCGADECPVRASVPIGRAGSNHSRVVPTQRGEARVGLRRHAERRL